MDGLWNPKEVWSFSPFVDLSIYRWVRRNLRKPRFDRQVLLLILIVGMQMIRMWLARLYPGWLFSLDSSSFAVKVCICVCPAVVVAIPLKIWNSSRIEIKLKEQKRLVLEARFDALQRQINPHFLFQHLEFDRIARPLPPGNGAGDDCAAGQHFARACLRITIRMCPSAKS